MQEQSIFIEALEIADPAQRADYLDRLCGHDPALRQRIARLLERHKQSDCFLETPAIKVAGGAAESMREGPGTVIGPYQLLEQIGEGGFGLVFMAEQREPVQRQVALKLIKPGMDSRHIIARFEAERQALALMDHANIAHVLDAGTSTTGRPYFVMELCRGVPITDYCDHHGLDTRQRLHLFVAVCQAVQHAHLKGIIHRDLKPSNVLVTVTDGAPAVKVIDFGIAKALGRQLADKAALTSGAQLLGTPAYMSPEQAELAGDIDTRSDVYSLGVLLYELLTGVTPFDKDRLRAADFDKVRQIIRQEEPPRPSTRLNTLGDAATTVSAQRRSEPRRLSRLLRGELDWIVMKALEKERDRRYESASAFAADLERYLRDEAVTARPPSAWYRLRKFSRRRRWSLTLAAVLSVAVATVTVLSTANAMWLNAALVRSEAHRNRAEGAEKSAKESEETAKGAERSAKEQLFAALVLQARASRTSGRAGQRFGSLTAVRDAVKIARELNMPNTAWQELRNEAIAALALADMRVAKEWDGCPAGIEQIDFDDRLERYGWVDEQGHGSIRRVADNSAVCRFRLPAGQWRLFLSPNGRFCAVQGGALFKLFDCAQPEPRAIVDKSDEAIGRSGAFSPNNECFAVTTALGWILVYHVPSGTLLRRMRVEPGVNDIQFHPDNQRLAAATQGGVEIHDVRTGNLVADLNFERISTTGRLPKHAVPYSAVTWHPGGKIIAAVQGGVIWLWDIEKQKALGGWVISQRASDHRLAFNRAGDLVATNGPDGVLRLWDWRNQKLLFKHYARMTPALRFGSDDRTLACEVVGDKLRVWEIDAGREYRTLDRRGSEVRGLAIRADGRTLVAAEMFAVAVWDLDSRRLAGWCPGPKTADGFTMTLRSVCLEPNGDVLTFGPSGLRRWRIRHDPSTSEEAQITGGELLPMPWADGGLAQTADGTVSVFAQPKGALVRRQDQPGQDVLLEPHWAVGPVAVSPDGKWAVTCPTHPHPVNRHSAIRVWDAKSGNLIKELATGVDCQAVFSRDGAWLASKASRNVRVWAVGSWAEHKAMAGVGDWIAFAPDNRTLAVETGAGAIRLVDIQSGRDYAQLQDPNQDRSNGFVFSPDGDRLAAIAGDATAVRVWNLGLIRKGLAEMGLDWEATTPKQ